VTSALQVRVAASEVDDYGVYWVYRAINDIIGFDVAMEYVKSMDISETGCYLVHRVVKKGGRVMEISPFCE
jgi:hypothetical protein